MHELCRLPLVLLGLAVVAAGQTPATFTLYGTGCNGAPVSSCLTQNDVSPSLIWASLPNEYGYPVLNTTGMPIQVVGFEVFTVQHYHYQAASASGNTGVLRDGAGAGATTHTLPAFQPEAVGRITVTSTPGWYSTSVYPPVAIQTGEAFWLSVDAFSRIVPPQALGGVPGPTSPWWRRPNYLSNAWSVSNHVSNPIFRIHCLPATPTVPTLSATGLPQLGQNFSLQVGGGQPMQPALLIWAYDNTQWLSLPTPVDLAPLGAPNCFLYTSSDLIEPLLLDATGQGVAPPLTIPNDPGLIGLTWFQQAATFTSGANQIDLLFTNAATAVVGN